MLRTLAPLAASLLLALSAAAQSPPASFQWTVSNGSNSFLAEFEQHSARGPNFAVQVQQPDGSFATHTPSEVRTYLGTIAERPGAMASALRRADGSVHYHVLFEGGAEWINAGGSTTLRNDPNWTPNYPSFVADSGGAGSDIWAAEIGVDLPHSQYAVDGNVDAALEMIEHSVNTVNLIYLRDAGIVHRLGRVVIRADAAVDPYAGMTSTGPLLTEIGNQWNNVLPPSAHDAALVATSATGGGLAAVGVIGSPGYSSNGASSEGDFSIVWRHEVGHNWSLGHFDGDTPEGKTINSGNSQSRMSGPEQAKAVAHRQARAAFLDNLGPYSEPIPPRASLDRASYLPQSAPLTLDVLDNDHDANAEPIAITSFDTSSALGGVVALSPGTGPGGRDELLYTPPSVPSAATDRFRYRIADSAGREAVGNVMTKLSSDSELLAHFSMDAGVGAVAHDSSAHLRDASFDGGPNWDAGTIGGGIAFDGVDDQLLASAPDVLTANFTITAWVKRDGQPNDWAGIVFCRGGNTTSGLNFGTGIGLRYHWAGEKWDWVPGLAVPDDTWTFVALAVTPTAATIYMDDGTGLRSETNVGPHAPEPFDAALTIGRDPNSSARSFRGSLDDVRVFARTLGATEIEALAAGLGSAADPAPAQLAALSNAAPALAWTASPGAIEHRVYLSPTYTDVRDGLPSADQGLVTSRAWQAPWLAEGAWFWRVDSSDGTHWVEGPVWSFSVDEPAPWSTQGSALAGVDGEPLLTAAGSLEPLSVCALDLHHAAPGAPAGLFLALSSSPTPFKGGTLLPVPWVDLAFRTTQPDGGFAIPFVFPPGVPAGTQLWAQWAVMDAAAPAGVSLSNAVLGVTP